MSAKRQASPTTGHGRVLPAAALMRATAVQRIAGIQYSVAVAPYGSGTKVAKPGHLDGATAESTLGERSR